MSIYEEEANILNRKGRSGGNKTRGSDFAWLSIEKPERVNAKTKKRVRIVQQLPWIDGPNGRVPDVANPKPRFWQRVPVHSAQLGGQWVKNNCPENPDIDGWRDNCQCAMCALQKELWAAKVDEYDKIAKAVGFRWRIYYNMIDLDNPASHWVEQDGGSYLIRPFIWACSRGVHGEIIEACIAHGPVEDLQVGYNLTIVCKRVGKADNEIRYSIECDEQPTPLDSRLIPVAQRAFDLSVLAKPASDDDLRKMAEAMDPRRRGARTPTPMPAAPPAPPSRAASPPPTHPSGPADGGHYHVSDGGVLVGQAETVDQIVGYLINAKKFPPALQVWASGMQDWVPASDVQEIDSAFRAAYDKLNTSRNSNSHPPARGAPPPPPSREVPPPPQKAPQASGGPPASYQPTGGYPVAPEPPTAPTRPSQPGPPPPPGNGGKPPGGPPSF